MLLAITDNFIVFTGTSAFSDLVVKQLKTQISQNEGDQHDNDAASISQQLKGLLPKVQDIALSARRTCGQSQEEQ